MAKQRLPNKWRVVSVNNRGTKDCPFGFVYFANETRIGFGAHRDNSDPLAIWACHQTPDDLPPYAAENARSALRDHFPHLRGA